MKTTVVFVDQFGRERGPRARTTNEPLYITALASTTELLPLDRVKHNIDSFLMRAYNEQPNLFVVLRTPPVVDELAPFFHGAPRNVILPAFWLLEENYAD